MTLSEYFQKTGESQRHFAKRAEILPQTVYTILKGHGTTARTAVRIIDATGGLVRLQDLVGTRPLKKGASKGNVERRD